MQITYSLKFKRKLKEDMKRKHEDREKLQKKIYCSGFRMIVRCESNMNSPGGAMVAH